MIAIFLFCLGFWLGWISRKILTERYHSKLRDSWNHSLLHNQMQERRK
jgi:hypothetical protein